MSLADVAGAFADLKKKKKKKKVVVDEAVDDQVPQEQMQALEITEPTQQPGPGEPEEPQQQAINQFQDLKKKKKTKKLDFEKQLEIAPVAVEDVILSKEYSYKDLLDRIFRILVQNNPDLQKDRKKYTLQPPQVLREGSKKTAFANILDISKHMRRQPDHLVQYMFSELGTSGSIDGAGRLVIKGRFQQKQIENVLKRYIVEYVTCKTCKSAETLMSKENRLFFLQCESCGSTRSVSAIKTGFVAQTGKRAKAPG